MLTFNAEQHEYFWDGQKVPGVTTVLKEAGLIDFSMINPEILERACAFGIAGHKVTELYDKNDLAECPDALLPILEAWKRFLNDYDVEVLEVEQKVYSKKFRYAGTLDRIIIPARISKYKTVLDLKVGETLAPAYAIQTSAYENAYNEDKPVKEKARQRMIVQLCTDGTYKLPKKEYFSSSDFSVFLSALTLTNWKKRKGLKHGISN